MTKTLRNRLRAFSTERLLELLRETSAKEAVNWSERKNYVVTDESIVKTSERDEMVAFLLEVCEREDMSLSVETFSLFVHLLDRFLSSYKVKSKYLECLAVACLYIACKVKEEDENIAVTSEFLAECECKCSIGELLRMEQMVLIKFEWNVNDTTAIDFVQIYHALLVNEFKRATDNKLVASPIRERETSEIPAQLDILAQVEHRLKQCLCVSELAGHYRPQLMAYSLISLEMEKVMNEMSDGAVVFALSNALELIKSMGKLGYESIDKCKHQIVEHASELDEVEEIVDTWALSCARFNRPYGMSPILYTHLDVIEEVDEEDDNEQIDHDKSGELSGDEFKLDGLSMSASSAAANSSACCDYSTSSSASSLALSSVSSVTYADVVLGRQIDAKKRKREHTISFSSDNEDIDN